MPSGAVRGTCATAKAAPVLKLLRGLSDVDRRVQRLAHSRGCGLLGVLSSFTSAGLFKACPVVRAAPAGNVMRPTPNIATVPNKALLMVLSSSQRS
jgi:hypothetical protein